MKILSIHINNYGKLSNYDYNFNDVTTFLEDNGYGKSTIVSFIKAMFYGLETIRDNSPLFVDRLHFYPFKGGKFGGSIEFLYKGQKYRIERDFDIKSEAKDSMKVYCKNNETNELGKIPGVSIFGINKESFERLIIIDSDKINIASTSDINKKLNNYAMNVGESFDIDKAIDKIKAKKKDETKASKKSSEDIKYLDIEIKNLEDIQTNLAHYYSELNETNDQKEKASLAYSSSVKDEAILEKWKVYDSFISDIEEKKKELNEISSKYKKELPNDSDLQKAKDNSNSLTSIVSEIKGGEVPLNNVKEIEELNNKYSHHMPNSVELDEIEENIKEYEAKGEAVIELSKEEKTQREIELENHFSSYAPNSSDINVLEQGIKDLEEKENSLHSINEFVSERIIQEAKNNKKPILLILLILTILLIGGGVGLLFVNLIIGIILVVLGVIIGIVDMFIYLKASLNNMNKIETIIEKPNPIYLAKRNEIDAKRSELTKALMRYQYFGNNLSVSVYQLKSDLNEYNHILEDRKGKQVKLEKCREELTRLQTLLSDYFNKINMLDLPYKKALAVARDDLVKFATLNKTISLSKENNVSLEEKKNDLINQIKDFYLKYEIDEAYPIEKIEKDKIDYSRISLELNKKEKETSLYKENNNLITRPKEVNIDLDSLKSEMDNANTKYATLLQEINELEDKVSSLDDYKNRLDTIKNEKEISEKYIKIYDALMVELANADQRLKDKYISPIQEKFCYYANLIEETIGEKVSMDKDYKISFDREGSLRSFEHLSSGNLAICALCFRLALLDNMFNEEVPFVIMDDPFVNLDSNHLDKTKELVKKLSLDKQIIYFTCHESRNI